MDDRDFFDLLFQQFAKTTHAEDAFWASKDARLNDDNLRYQVYAVQQDGTETHVAWFRSETDADFVAAIAGCLPDLVRRLHAALDEADRLDEERDEAQHEILQLALEAEHLDGDLGAEIRKTAALAAENEELKSEVGVLLGNAGEDRRRIEDLEQALATARAEASYHRPLG